MNQPPTSSRRPTEPRPLKSPAPVVPDVTPPLAEDKKPTRRRPRPGAGAVLFFCGILGLAGCEQVAVKAVDPTPPTAFLQIYGLGSAMIPIDASTGPRTVSIRATDVFTLVALAEDRDGGIRTANYFGESSLTCISGNLGRRVTSTMTDPAGYVSTASVGQLTNTMGGVARQINVAEFLAACPAGFTITRFTMTFVATGRNFSNLAAQSPSVTFVLVP